MIMKALADQSLPVYGKGENIRDWLYVEDHCFAIDLVMRHGKEGEIYNIGGHNEKTNLEIVHAVCNLLDKKIPKAKSYIDQVEFVTDRPGHDMRYAIDATKISTFLGWRALETFASGMEKTVDWYLQKYQSK